jgi:16S rRNA (cytosine967-C5)-methyltransferase
MNEVPGTISEELYTGVRGSAIKILNRIDRTDAYLEKLLDNELKSGEFTGADKSLLYEIVHGVIRWQGRIDWILNGFYKGQYSKIIPTIKNALRIAIYQILFLDRVPDYAAVNEAVEFIKKIHGQKAADLTNAVLRSIIRSKNAIRFPNPEEDLVGYYSAYYSHPAWLVKRWINRYGKENAEALLISNNEKPSLTLKVNPLVISANDFKKLLVSVNLKFTQGRFLPEYFKLKGMTNITDWEYYAKGSFAIQDESAGLSCTLLDPKPGMKVLDLCAAPGGKSAFLAGMMNNTGEITAIDRYESRLKILEKNLERLKIKNVKTVAADAFEYNEKGYDRILVDAPCSGLGTLSKKPDIKWKKEYSDIKKLNELQYSLLKQASTLLNPGGVLVYSTCTIEPDENFDIIKKFLAESPDFALEKAPASFLPELLDENGCIQTLPHIHKTDGAFAAKLVRKP